ncbi:MAG: pyridoxal 5'-phosphate synthase lyase subunit PdxS [Thermoplasmata archaeon]|nr:pyridoxal 5'-phosphate synthase lyase subunit PdxS [Thermoplasmata archaeon]
MADPTTKLRFGTELVKRGFAKMTQGGVIMDVTTAEQAAVAEEAGAVAVMALERVPADIRAVGGVARMADPLKIKEIQERVSIPVMAKCRIGHTSEAQILESLGVDMVDESEVLTPADPFHHVAKKQFKVPFVCGARNLGEALRRIDEGAAMIRTKGEAGTGNIVEAVRHIWTVRQEIDALKALPKKEVGAWAAQVRVPEKLANEVRELGRLPVVNFAAGGIATPADAALCRLLGVDGVFVGSGIFKAEHPRKVARAIVEASLHFDDPAVLARISAGLGEAMRGLDVAILAETELMQGRESMPAPPVAPKSAV